MSFKQSIFEQPSESDEKLLQQAIISGLIENLTRQITVFDQNGNIVDKTSKTKVLYESQSSKEKLKIHQTSSILTAANAKRGDYPEYVVYSEIYAVD